ncbi:MAG: helix-turn-helix transcriptional regulator [Marmoricola sp.]
MSRRSNNPSATSTSDADLALAVVVPLPRDPFLNTDDACAYLGVPKATLLTWRVRRPGYGPRAVKAGGRLKYRLSELDRWLQDHEESFPIGEDNEEIDAALDRAGHVHTRNRASRVRGGALPAAQP